MAGHKPLTRHQASVLEALSSHGGPLSAYAMLEQLREQGFRAPLQVYRALDKLVEYGLVHRIESLNAFVACSHPHEHREGLVVFAICGQCGHTDEFADDVLEKQLGGWAREHAFRTEKTTVEMRGTCAACLAAA